MPAKIGPIPGTVCKSAAPGYVHPASRTWPRSREPRIFNTATPSANSQPPGTVLEMARGFGCSPGAVAKVAGATNTCRSGVFSRLCRLMPIIVLCCTNWMRLRSKSRTARSAFGINIAGGKQVQAEQMRQPTGHRADRRRASVHCTAGAPAQTYRPAFGASPNARWSAETLEYGFRA